MRDHRMGPGLFTDVLDVLERHWFARGDDQLDVPGYRPQYGWKPARGTGVAPDIVPPARHPRRRGA